MILHPCSNFLESAVVWAQLLSLKASEVGTPALQVVGGPCFVGRSEKWLYRGLVRIPNSRPLWGNNGVYFWILAAQLAVLGAHGLWFPSPDGMAPLASGLS